MKRKDLRIGMNCVGAALMLVPQLQAQETPVAVAPVKVTQRIVDAALRCCCGSPGGGERWPGD